MSAPRPTVLVLASTYPRWRDDPEPPFVHELCRRLRQDFDVVAVVPGAPGADPDGLFDGIEVVRYRYAPRAWQRLVNDGGIVANLRRARWKWLLVPGFVLGQWWAARRVLRRRRIDVVHAHWLLPQGVVARLLGAPYLVTSHGGDLFGLRGALLLAVKRWVARGAAGMTVVSEAMRAECARLAIAAPRLDVIPMGVDLRERFTPQPSPREPATLLFVGRLVAKKGLRHLLDALPRVLEHRPDARLEIIGFGPEEAALRAQVQAQGLEAAVSFLGARPQSELPQHYRRASLFVAPFVTGPGGDQEGLPVVLMEAIGCGCPAVVGRVAGLDDLLGAHVSSIAVDPTDAAALADAILAVLLDPARAQARALEVAQAARARIDWEAVGARYRAALQAALAS
jgi:glycosyltransferase involved in cell wall biosynthesis